MNRKPGVHHGRWAVLTLAVVASVVASCGIPEDRVPRAITRSVETATPAPTPTTAADDEVPRVEIFLLDANGRVHAVTREVATLKISDVLPQLTLDPMPDEVAENLTSAVPKQMTLIENDSFPSLKEGLATVNLEPGSLETLEGGERFAALAQIVWTLTNYTNVDRVQILINGAPITWLTPDGGEQTKLTEAAFRSFDPTYVAPTPTPVPTSAPTPTPAPTATP
jgi:hypothetical protein